MPTQEKDKVRIHHPRQINQGTNRTVPTIFVVVVTARGSQITDITGTITDHSGTKIVGAVKAWQPTGTDKLMHGARYRWLIRFGDRQNPVPEDDYKLEVFGLNKGAQINGCVDKVPKFTVKKQHSFAGKKPGAFAAPTILYPNVDQDIIDERDYFVAYGEPVANQPIQTVTVTPDGQDAIDANSVFNGSDFWAAEFDLSDIDPVISLTLTATDNQPVPISEPINIT